MSKKTVDLERAAILVLVGLLLVVSLLQTFQITEFKSGLSAEPVVINTQSSSSQPVASSTISTSAPAVAKASTASAPSMVGGC